MSILFLAGHQGYLLDSLQRLHSDISRICDGAAPTQDDLETAPILNRWHYGARLSACMHGLVHGHPIVGDGRAIHTSELFAIDAASGWARTWSRFYRLGVPSDGFSRGCNA